MTRIHRLLAVVVAALLVTAGVPGLVHSGVIDSGDSPIGVASASHDPDHVVAIGDRSGTVRVIKASDQSTEWTAQLSGTPAIFALHFLPSKNLLVIGAGNGVIQARDTGDGSIVWNKTASAGDIEAITAYGNGSYIFAAEGSNVVRRYSGNGTVDYSKSQGDTSDVTLGPNETYVYSVTDNNNAVRRYAGNGTQDWSFSPGSSNGLQIEVAPNGTQYFYKDVNTFQVRETEPDGSNFVSQNNSAVGNSIEIHDSKIYSTNGKIARYDLTLSEEYEARNNPIGHLGDLDVEESGNDFYVAFNDGGSSSSGGYLLSLTQSDGSQNWNYSNPNGYDIDAVATGTLNPREVSGVVKDVNGNAIDNASVTTSQGDDITTGSDGAYSFTALDGTYRVTGDADGFQANTTFVEVNGSDVTHDIILLNEVELRLDVNGYMDHGSTQPYEVWEVYENASDVNVTANATVSSSDVSVVSVNSSAFLLEATGDVSVNKRVVITAEYNNSTVSRNVTVANLTVDNIKILPPEYRIAATIGDPDRVGGTQLSVLVLIIATLVAVVGKYGMSAFGGLSAGFLVLVIGFFGGWVSLGLLLVALFLSVFLGLNLAANIDYQVRR